MTPGSRSEGHASLTVNVAKALPQKMRNNVFELTNVRTDPDHRGKGEATNLMLSTCLDADVAGKFLLVQVDPDEDGPLDRQQLADFYMQFNFVPIQAEPVLLMVRPCVSWVNYGKS